MQADNSGISYGSSSGSSDTSKRGAVDEYTLRLATDSVKAIVLKNVNQFIMPHFLFVVIDMLSFTMYFRYTSLESAISMVIPMFLAALVARSIPSALSQGAAALTMRNISKNQLLAANIYFAHYFLLMVLYAIVIVIIYISILQSVVEPGAKQYLLAHVLIGTLANTFSYGIFPFLTEESRFLPVFSMCLVFLGLFEFLSSIFYQNSFLDKSSLMQISIALIAAYIVCFIIGFVVILNIQMLGIKYAGTLKFAVKRLSPIRAKVFGQIALNSCAFLFVSVTDDLMVAIAAFLISMEYKDSTEKTLGLLQLLLFRFYSRIMEAISRGVSDCFEYVAGYNIGMKKIARIFQIIVFCLLLELCACAVIGAVMLITVPWMWDLLVPIVNEPLLKSYLREKTRFAAYAGSWSEFLAMPAYLSLSILQVEHKILLSCLLLSPKFIFALVCMIIHFFISTEAGELEFYLALSEILSCFAGLSCLLYYVMKYQKLFKINSQAERKVAITDEASIDIRASVMAELGKSAEDMDEDERREKASARLNSVFNKQIALKSSRNFMTLRQSIGYRDSTISSATEDRVSVIRASQINRESIMK